MLTVAEAARALGVGRSVAYARARMWQDTGGRAGLPSVRVGRSLRVGTADLERLLGRGLSARDVQPSAEPRRAARPRIERNARGDRERRSDNNVNDHDHDDDDDIDNIDGNHDATNNDDDDSRIRGIAADPIDTCHPSGGNPAPAAPPGPRPPRPPREPGRC